MTRGYGYRPDSRDTRDLPFGIIEASDPPHKASLRRWSPAVLDQRSLNSCVAHAVAYAIGTCHAHAGVEHPELLSRLFVYWNSRSYHGDANNDDGTYLRTALKSVNKIGFCPEAVWPYDERAVREQPPHEAYREAIDQRIVAGYFRIDSTGEQRVRDVKRAIAAGFPVVFGTGVSEQFTNALPGDSYGPPEQSAVVGGHAMCVLEYEGGVMRGPQSWGESYGDDGWFCIVDSYLEWEWTRDIWAIKAAPPFAVLT